MKILDDQPIKNCFDGSFMKEITFSSEITKDFVDYLSLVGELEYYADFSRPFYRITRPYGYIIKGIVGNHYLRIYFSRAYLDESIEHFLTHVTGFTTHNKRGKDGTATSKLL